MDGSNGAVEAKNCDFQNNQKWGYLKNRLTNVATGLCLQEGRAGGLLSANCNSNNQAQKWNIEITNSFVIIESLQSKNVLVAYSGNDDIILTLIDIIQL